MLNALKYEYLRRKYTDKNSVYISDTDCSAWLVAHKAPVFMRIQWDKQDSLCSPLSLCTSLNIRCTPVCLACVHYLICRETAELKNHSAPNQRPVRMLGFECYTSNVPTNTVLAKQAKAIATSKYNNRGVFRMI